MADHDQGPNPSECAERAISSTVMTRHSFVTATLTACFALAVRPIAAATIATDGSGLTAGEIQIRAADGHIPAYRAKPENGSALPVVLVVQEIFGVHEHIKDVCDSEGRRKIGDRGLSECAPCLLCGLSAELQEGGSGGRMEAATELVQAIRDGVAFLPVVDDGSRGGGARSTPSVGLPSLIFEIGEISEKSPPRDLASQPASAPCPPL